MSRVVLRVAVVVSLLGGLLAASAGTAHAAFSDVPTNFWAKTAIDHVASTNAWMQDYGTTSFKPEVQESKRRFAMHIVKAFDPDGTVDPAITFPDLPATDPYYPYANIAVKHGWMTVQADGKFKPVNAMSTNMVHRGLVIALGLQAEVDGLNAIHTDGGLIAADTPIAVNTGRFPYMVLGMQLGLRFNHATEAEDVLPTTVLTRDEVAYSLWKAKTVSSWTLNGLAVYRDIELPALSAQVLDMAEFGFNYAGYPYIWAGEWHVKTPSGYCCGTQVQGGFDCSGFMWWLLKKPSGGYDNTSIRGYTGWSLPERSSAAMAAAAPTKLTYTQTKPGDLMFHDDNANPDVVSHVNVYLGNGWALDGSSSRGGVSLIKVDAGWYYDHFMWSRRLTL